jgi:hypothetical protein
MRATVLSRLTDLLDRRMEVYYTSTVDAAIMQSTNHPNLTVWVGVV